MVPVKLLGLRGNARVEGFLSGNFRDKFFFSVLKSNCFCLKCILCSYHAAEFFYWFWCLCKSVCDQLIVKLLSTLQFIVLGQWIFTNSPWRGYYMYILSSLIQLFQSCGHVCIQTSRDVGGLICTAMAATATVLALLFFFFFFFFFSLIQKCQSNNLSTQLTLL